jgi:hypothetical protein
MWLPTVLRVTTKRAVMSLFAMPRANKSEDVDLPVRETGDVDATWGDPMAGCGEHSAHGLGVVASCAGVGNELVRCFVEGSQRQVRTGFEHRLVAVGCAKHSGRG